MALTDPEKARIRYHLGYTQLVNSAPGLTAGQPVAKTPAFLLERSFELLDVHGEVIVRDILDTLNATEQRLKDAQCQLPTDRVGNITLAGGNGSPRTGNGMLVTDRFDAEVRRWANRLADVLAVPLYPYSTKLQGNGGAGSIPVRR